MKPLRLEALQKDLYSADHIFVMFLACYLKENSKVIHVTWKDCSTAASKAKLNGVTITPELPVVGQAFDITADVTLNEDVVGGTIDYTIKKGWLKLLSGTADMCTNTDVTLPMGAGSIKIAGVACPKAAGPSPLVCTGQINEVPITGSVTIDLVITDSLKNNLGCVNITADVEDTEEVTEESFKIQE